MAHTIKSDPSFISDSHLNGSRMMFVMIFFCIHGARCGWTVAGTELAHLATRSGGRDDHLGRREICRLYRYFSLELSKRKLLCGAFGV